MGIIVSQHAIDRTNVKSPDFYQKLPLCRSEEHTCRFCMESWPSWARVLEAAPRAPPTMKVEFAGHPTRYLPVAPGPRGMQQFKVPPAIPRRACPLRMQAFAARARGRARSTPIQVHSCSLWSGASAALHCPLSLHGSSSSAANPVGNPTSAQFDLHNSIHPQSRAQDFACCSQDNLRQLFGISPGDELLVNFECPAPQHPTFFTTGSTHIDDCRLSVTCTVMCMS